MAGPGVRVLIHAGFHKTGTSSLQDYLGRHRAALAPWLAYYGKVDFPAVDAAAMRYGTHPFAWRLRAFRRALRRFLADVPEAPVIVLSREAFAGSMPGHRDWRGRLVTAYAPTATPLARTLLAECRRRFGPAAQVEFLFTTREREAWIRSVYGHLLRAIRLRDDFATFRARFPDLIDLRAEAGRIAGALGPAPVHVAALERHTDRPEGPAGIVLDLAHVPEGVRRALPPARRWNMGQTEAVEAEFLRLNRLGGPRDALKARKDALGRRTRGPGGGQKRQS